MSAQQRYAGLSQAERRLAARHVRRASDRRQLNQQRLNAYAELALYGVLYDGQVALHWVYAWELATRVHELRYKAGIVDGAR